MSNQTEVSLNFSKIKGSLLWAIFALIAAGMLIAIALPTNCGYPKRAKVSEMMATSDKLRSHIENLLISNSPIQNLDKSSLSQSKYISYSKVSETGEIIMFSEELGAIMVLTPALTSEHVTWSCYVSPQKNCTRTMSHITAHNYYKQKGCHTLRVRQPML